MGEVALMKFALVQYTSENGKAHHFISDIIRLLYLSLIDLGHSCCICHNQIIPDRINILFSWVRLPPDAIDSLILKKIPYIVFQPEILSEKGLNDTTQMNWDIHLPYIWKLFSHSLQIWELFDFNLPILQEKNLRAKILPLGYHPKLESSLPPKPIYDAVFFGSHSPYRKSLFEKLSQKGIELNNVNFAPNLFRDDLLRKSRISLNIPLNDTKMFHVSPNRVAAGLYHGVPTVSLQCRCSSWLKPMLHMLDTNNFVEELQIYLVKR